MNEAKQEKLWNFRIIYVKFPIFAQPMVRIFAILLTLVYAFSATGASIHLHYCCGKPQHIAMQERAPANTGDCPMCVVQEKPLKPYGSHHQLNHACNQETPAHDKCYNVKVELKKTTEKHIINGEKGNFAKVYPLELVVFSLLGIFGGATDLQRNERDDGYTWPPPAVPLFIQHCTYRI